MKTFECLRCGDCCRNLWEDWLGFPVGVFLLPTEKAWFSDELVRPFWSEGIGRMVKIYQMIAKDCPHLITEGKYNSCAIYQHRPLACRAFPMSGQVNYSTKCRATKDVRGGLQITGDMTRSYAKINNITKHVIQSANGLLWVYNFQSNTWERVTKELLAPVRKL